MSRIIKDRFSFSEEPELKEEFNWGNALSSIMGIAGTGFQKTIKEKIAAVILDKIGIMEDTILSQIVQEVVDAIPFKDYPAILTGEKANVEYLAPYMAQAITEFFERRGLDPIAQQIGIDPKGWLYSTIRNGLQSPQGKEKLKNFFVEAFGGKDSKGSVARDAFSDLSKADKDKISGEVEKKLSMMDGKSDNQKNEEPGYLSDFLKSFSGTK
jgi:hypothetical protein